MRNDIALTSDRLLAALQGEDSRTDSSDQDNGGGSNAERMPKSQRSAPGHEIHCPTTARTVNSNMPSCDGWGVSQFAGLAAWDAAYASRLS